MSKRKPIVHKWFIKKVQPGYNPNQPLCGSDGTWLGVHMAKDWKDVTCQGCHMIRGHKRPNPHAPEIHGKETE